MEQPWNQQREGGDAGYAKVESSSCHAADLDKAMTTMTTDRREVNDGALLMELIMEDLPPSSDLLLDDGDVDRQLSRVIRSLEAEIGGAGDVMMAGDGGEGLDRIEDVLSDDDDMDGYADYEAASSSFLASGHDEAEGWCVYTNNGYEISGSVLGYDAMVDHQYYYCSAEGSADHMYLPLWE